MLFMHTFISFTMTFSIKLLVLVQRSATYTQGMKYRNKKVSSDPLKLIAHYRFCWTLRYIGTLALSNPIDI